MLKYAREHTWFQWDSSIVICWAMHFNELLTFEIASRLEDQLTEICCFCSVFLHRLLYLHALVNKILFNVQITQDFWRLKILKLFIFVWVAEKLYYHIKLFSWKQQMLFSACTTHKIVVFVINGKLFSQRISTWLGLHAGNAIVC